MSATSTRQRLERVASAVMPRGARVSVQATESVGPVFLLTITTGSITHELVTGWAGAGWPADVERLLQIAPKINTVAAHRLSIGARELLGSRELNWFDESGAAQIVAPAGLVVVRDGQSPVSSRASSRRSTWTNATITVAEAILTGSSPRVESVETSTGLSRGAVAKALATLEQSGLLQRRVPRGPGSARRVSDFDRLLDEYTAAISARAANEPAMLLHRLWSDPLEALVESIAPSLTAASVDWAVTGAAASMLLAPYLSNLGTVDLYVDAETFFSVHRLEDLLGGRRTDRGHRITVRRSPNALTATAGAIVDGVRCAPDVRVYADLTALGGRFAEAAHHLREVRIDDRTET